MAILKRTNIVSDQKLVESGKRLTGLRTTRSLVFMGLNALAGCFFGHTTSGGAVGVGKATRQAVVSSRILILIANFFLMKLFS